MNVLVYGAGVIGGQLAHTLCALGHDVTVVARGAWAETLRQSGLRIRHYVQRTDTVDHPRVLEAPDDGAYDIVFAVMRYRQMEAILPALAAIDSPLVVLVGNNLSAAEMERAVLSRTQAPKTVLFGFGSTAGRREDGRIVAVHTGDGKLTVGALHADASFAAKDTFARLFTGSKYAVSYCDDMDAWLKYHAAFILPIVYLSYATGCDLRGASRAQRAVLLDAAGDAYGLLMKLGCPVRPVGDEEYLKPGVKRGMAAAMMLAAAKTKLGALCTTEHCRHAPEEMEALDRAFLALRAGAPDFSMPAFDRLRDMTPPWEEIRRTYGGV